MERINRALDPLIRPIEGLYPDPENARLHPERNLESIKFSLQTFGQQKHIVAMSDGKVIAGSGLLTAAIEMGWQRVACITFDSEDEALTAAYAIADNRTAELATWDFTTLDAQLARLEAGIDLPRLGFAIEDWQNRTPNLDVLNSFAAHVEGEHPGGSMTFTFNTEEDLAAVLDAAKSLGKPALTERLVQMCRDLES